jgi:hypothetical protein
VERNHLIEDLAVEAFFENVGFEGSFGLFEGKGDIVAGSDVAAVVEASFRSVGSFSYLCCLVFRLCWLEYGDVLNGGPAQEGLSCSGEFLKGVDEGHGLNGCWNPKRFVCEFEVDVV